MEIKWSFKLPAAGAWLFHSCGAEHLELSAAPRWGIFNKSRVVVSENSLQGILSFQQQLQIGSLSLVKFQTRL